MIKKMDEFLPDYEFREIHALDIRAAPEEVFAAIKELTAAELSPLIFMMLDIRNLPARLIRRNPQAAFQPGPFLDQLYKGGFIPLSETPNREIIFGMIGQPWKLAGEEDPHVTDAAAFKAFDDPNFAQVTCNLMVTETSGGLTRCSTETRVHVPNPRVRRKFAFYWRVISTGSGLIRILWLRGIRRRAERARGSSIR